MALYMPSSFSTRIIAAEQQINKVLLCFLSILDLEPWRRRPLAEELSILVQQTLHIRRKLHINEQVEWNMTGKPSISFYFPCDHYTHYSKIACCGNEIHKPHGNNFMWLMVISALKQWGRSRKSITRPFFKFKIHFTHCEDYNNYSCYF